jgi:hypothetical protein
MKARNRLNHGSVSVDQVDAELPLGPLRELAEKYPRLALLRRLRERPMVRLLAVAQMDAPTSGAGRPRLDGPRTSGLCSAAFDEDRLRCGA